MKRAVLLSCFLLVACEGAATVAGIIDDIDDWDFAPDVDLGVSCTNADGTLTAFYTGGCPPGWTPANPPLPDLVCRNPEGRLFCVNANQCPPEWTREQRACAIFAAPTTPLPDV